MKLVNIEIIKDELERLIRNYRFYSSTEAKYRYEAYKELSEWLDGLEVEDVDLEKHLKEDIEDVYFDLNGVAVKGATYYLTVEDIKEIAKHFYELGLKAKGG